MKYFIVFCLAVLATASEVDTNTFSNYLDVKLTHMHLEWLLDLEH
jgi:leukotriene-A4 hydrolase